jgi:hypothetical protein
MVQMIWALRGRMGVEDSGARDPRLEEDATTPRALSDPLHCVRVQPPLAAAPRALTEDAERRKPAGDEARTASADGSECRR